MRPNSKLGFSAILPRRRLSGFIPEIPDARFYAYSVEVCGERYCEFDLKNILPFSDETMAEAVVFRECNRAARSESVFFYDFLIFEQTCFDGFDEPTRYGISISTLPFNIFMRAAKYLPGRSHVDHELGTSKIFFPRIRFSILKLTNTCLARDFDDGRRQH